MNVFTDLIEALGKLVDALKAFSKLTRAERENYIKTLGDTHQLLDTTLNMIITNLNEILSIEDDKEFLSESARLTHYVKWNDTERELRLCKNLRIAVRETETMQLQVAGILSVKDWETLLHLMYKILATEGELAGYLVESFEKLEKLAKSETNSTDAKTMRTYIERLNNILNRERRQLIQQELKLYEVI